MIWMPTHGYLITLTLQVVVILYVLRNLLTRYPGKDWRAAWTWMLAAQIFGLFLRFFLYLDTIRSAFPEWPLLLLPWAVSLCVLRSMLYFARAFPRHLPLRAAPPARITIDEASQIVTWNARAESLLGYPAAAILHESILRIIPERFHATHMAGIARWLQATPAAMPARRPYTFDAVHQDGSEFPVQVEMRAAAEREGRRMFDITIYKLIRV